MAGAYLQQFRIGIWVFGHIQHDPETVIGQHDGEFVPARVAFDHIDGAIAQRKTQLDITKSQCVTGFENEDMDEFGEVVGVVGEFFDSSGYEFP